MGYLNGDTETGVTIMQMNDGLDTGDMLDIIPVSIKPGETTGELFDRLAPIGGQVINEVLAKAMAGTLQPVVQEDELATYANKITKEMGAIDWHRSAFEIANQIRGLSPAPGCFTFLDEGKRIKVWQASEVTIETLDLSLIETAKTATVGTIIGVKEKSFLVATGNGVLEVFEVQPDNKKRMNAGDFCRGHQVKAGLILNA